MTTGTDDDGDSSNDDARSREDAQKVDERGRIRRRGCSFSMVVREGGMRDGIH